MFAFILVLRNITTDVAKTFTFSACLPPPPKKKYPPPHRKNTPPHKTKIPPLPEKKVPPLQKKVYYVTVQNETLTSFTRKFNTAELNVELRSDDVPSFGSLTWNTSKHFSYSHIAFSYLQKNTSILRSTVGCDLWTMDL